MNDTKYYKQLVEMSTLLQEHLFYSEFGGKLDYSDPWMPLYNGLSELRGKLLEELDMCELYPDGAITQGDKKLIDITTQKKEGN